MREEITRYLSAEKMTKDDLGNAFTMKPGEFVYDAKTVSGPWATMSQTSYDLIGAPGGLGLGKGQKHIRTEQGFLVLVEGCK